MNFLRFITGAQAARTISFRDGRSPLPPKNARALAPLTEKMAPRTQAPSLLRSGAAGARRRAVRHRRFQQLAAANEHGVRGDRRTRAPHRRRHVRSRRRTHPALGRRCAGNGANAAAALPPDKAQGPRSAARSAGALSCVRAVMSTITAAWWPRAARTAPISAQRSSRRAGPGTIRALAAGAMPLRKPRRGAKNAVSGRSHVSAPRTGAGGIDAACARGRRAISETLPDTKARPMSVDGRTDRHPHARTDRGEPLPRPFAARRTLRASSAARSSRRR